MATLDGNHAINEATNLLAVREHNELPRMHRGDLANTVDVGLSVVAVGFGCPTSNDGARRVAVVLVQVGANVD